MKTDEASICDTGSIIDGKWVIIERIGKGGMGEVYRAHQLNLKRDVAIKLISEELLQDLEENPEEVETAFGRFQREVQTMARVRHPNVLQIYDYGSVSANRNGHEMPAEYISMEYIPGNTLRFTMSEEGFEDEEELLIQWINSYYQPVLDGVEAIHRHGIVHRDLKPENILMDGDAPKIADFGLARGIQMKAVSNSWDVKGTWPYMAPEQFADFRKAGREADIYALGKILYEAISGKLDPKAVPFKSVALEDPQTPLLKGLDDILGKATCEDNQRRYQSIEELRRALQSVLKAVDSRKSDNGISTPAPTPALVRWMWVGIVTAILTVAAMTAYHLRDGIKTTQPPENHISSKTPAVRDDRRLPAELPATHLADDGQTMLMIDATDDTKAFYTDPSLVTFHHFVDFLNAVSGKLKVADGVVKKGDEIWIYLGDGSAANEQIIFINRRFQLRDAGWAAKPVVRVTWQGARAYAEHYNKQLPDFSRWQALSARHPEMIEAGDEVSRESANNEHAHMMAQSLPAGKGTAQTPTNGQEHPPTARVVKEWLADRLLQDEGKIISRVVQWPRGEQTEPPLRRHPWEGFADVGFRTIFVVDGR